MERNVLNQEDVKVFSFEDPPSVSKMSFTPPKQSANVLYKFMWRIEYLKEALEHKAIMPRYNEEKVEYLNIDGIEKLAFPMSCFCDIHLNKLDKHMDNYGYFGIGLSKKWGIASGIQPIKYVNICSKLRKDFSEIFSDIFKMSSEERQKYSHYHNYLLHDLFYMKPMDGEMLTSNKSYEKRNFHDEKEWRFIPDVNQTDTELPLVIDKEQMNPKSYISYSNGIKQKPELWLSFDIDTIKYIIVPNMNDRDEIIKFIVEKNIGKNEYERYTLISKILVFKELGEDW